MTLSALTSSSLQALVDACQQESLQPRAQENGSCFEIFRRAFDEADRVAQEALVCQYQRLIQKWIADFHSDVNEDFEDLVQEVWLRYWRSLRKKKPPCVAGNFIHLGELLKYLKLCVNSVMIDHQHPRQQGMAQMELSEATEAHLQAQFAGPTPEENFAEQERLRGLAALRAQFDTLVSDPRERRLFELLYERGLKPREVVREYAREFPEIEEVRRIEERVLKRIRRALNAPERRNA